MAGHVINRVNFAGKYFDVDVNYIAKDGTKRSYAGNEHISDNLNFYRSKLATLLSDYFGLNKKWNVELFAINYTSKNLKTKLLLENREIYPYKKGFFNFAIEYGANPTVTEVEISTTYEDLKKELIKYIENVETIRV